MVNCVGRTIAVCSLGVACILSTHVAGQEPATQKPKIAATIAVPIVSVEGKDNFDAYCAVCHGTTGKGDGPAAPAMKAAVPDLTTITQRNKGTFNRARVDEIIRGAGRTPTPAHGVETMPIWGDIFRHEDKARIALRIRNLINYLESIQVK
jgi:mono/diheme cytochrome c family protein